VKLRTRGAIAIIGGSLVSAGIAVALPLAPGAAIGLAVLGGAVTGMLLGRLVGVRPMIQALDDGLVSFAEGEYGIRLATDRGDELGDVARSFNRLGDQLRAAPDETYQKELMLDMVFRAAPLAIVLVDDDDRVAFANDAARELAVPAAPPVGERFATLLAALPPMLAAAIEKGDDELVKIERGGAEETFHVSRRWFDLRMRRHALYMIKPLTRELVRQEAEVWKKAIRVISHELNNSLAPIRSLVHSARKIVANPEHIGKLGGVFDTIEERAAHLHGFLDGYARLAKLPRPTPRDVAWQPFLDGVHALYPFHRRGELPARPGRFDPEQVQQALINLLKNASESGSPVDDIAIELVERDGGVAIRVLDRGKGMTDEVLASALRPFYSTKKTGSGLGLALCREIVDAHGGQLVIERRDGGGIAIECWFPGG